MHGFLSAIAGLNAWLNDIVWGAPMLLLIMGSSMHFTYLTHFVQFRHFRHIMRSTLGSMFGRKRTADRGAVSPFQAFCTALAATVGTGNIAGVAGAIALGGPGTVFWMWVSALFGMATKYAEVVLAIRFRTRNEKGEWVGGPMYYIVGGLGKKWKWLAMAFSAFGALAAFGIGNMTQVNTVAGSIVMSIRAFRPLDGIGENIIRVLIGLIVAFFAGLALLGGVRRVGRMAEKLVPFMSAVYIIAASLVIFKNISNIGAVLSAIFQGAFSPSAVIGGAFGISAMQALRLGVGRGIFSNEAGLGSAPIAHAAAETDSPVRQGFFGVFEVFADTIVICTITALAILLSGVTVPYGESAGAELTISAFQTLYRPAFASVVTTAGIILFALATILSWGLYGTRCAQFLFGERIKKAYLALFIGFIVVGATMNLAHVWAIADTLNGLMAIPNLIAVIALSGTVKSCTAAYFVKKSVR